MICLCIIQTSIFVYRPDILWDFGNSNDIVITPSGAISCITRCSLRNVLKLLKATNPAEEIVLALQSSRLLRSYDLEKLQQQQQQQRQEHQEQLHHLLEHGHRRPIIQDKIRHARTDTDLLKSKYSAVTNSVYEGTCETSGQVRRELCTKVVEAYYQSMHHRRLNKLFRSSLIVK